MRIGAIAAIAVLCLSSGMTAHGQEASPSAPSPPPTAPAAPDTSPPPQAAVSSLLNKAINGHLGIKSGSRNAPDASDNEDAPVALDMLGNNVRAPLRGKDNG